MEQVYSLHYTYKVWIKIFGPILIILMSVYSDKFMRGFVKDEDLERYKKTIKFIYMGQTLLSLVLLFSVLELFVNIYVKYKMGGYKQVEGVIENFEPSDGRDEFDVAGVHFYYDYKQFDPGYRTTRSNGGVFKENGQYVRIQYVEYRIQNVIAAIWVEKTDENDDLEIGSDSSP